MWNMLPLAGSAEGLVLESDLGRSKDGGVVRLVLLLPLTESAEELVSESDMVDSEDGGVAWLALPGADKVSCHGGCEV